MTVNQAVRFMEKRGAEYRFGMWSSNYYLGNAVQGGELTLSVNRYEATFSYKKDNGRNLDNKILIQHIPINRFRSTRHLADFLRTLGMPESE